MSSGISLIRGALHGIIWLALTACGTPQPPDAGARASPSTPTQIASPAGRWALEVYPEPTVPTPRLHMELRIDSVTGTRVFGALTHYLAGDVGVDPRAFPHFDGRVDERGFITLRIGHQDPAVSGFVLAGPLSGDTIALDVFVVGPDTASGRDRKWRLVRQPPAP